MDTTEKINRLLTIECVCQLADACLHGVGPFLLSAEGTDQAAYMAAAYESAESLRNLFVQAAQAAWAALNDTQSSDDWDWERFMTSVFADDADD